MPQGVEHQRSTQRDVSVAVAGQTSNSVQIFDYDAPKIFAVEPNVVPIQGGVNVTVRGSILAVKTTSRS